MEAIEVFIFDKHSLIVVGENEIQIWSMDDFTLVRRIAISGIVAAEMFKNRLMLSCVPKGLYSLDLTNQESVPKLFESGIFFKVKESPCSRFWVAGGFP